VEQSSSGINLIKNIAIYLLFLNAYGFASMWYDKKMAQTGNWRVKEKTLLIIAILGGSIGSLLGMHIFHHKTKHLRFKIGIPIIIFIQIFSIIIYKYNLYIPILEFLKNSI